jgi:hypothetical protein
MTFLEFEHLRTVSGASTSDVRIGRPWHGVSADATWPQSERTCGDVAQVWQKAGPKGKSAKSASEAEATFSNIQQLQWFLDYFQPQRVQNEASCLDYAWFFRQIGIAFCLILVWFDCFACFASPAKGECCPTNRWLCWNRQEAAASTCLNEWWLLGCGTRELPIWFRLVSTPGPGHVSDDWEWQWNT